MQAQVDTDQYDRSSDPLQQGHLLPKDEIGEEAPIGSPRMRIAKG